MPPTKSASKTSASKSSTTKTIKIHTKKCTASQGCVQQHGKIWEDFITEHIYRVPLEHEPRYNSPDDIRPEGNTRESGVAVSIKCAGSNSINFSSVMNILTTLISGKPLHVIIIQYNQTDGYKIIRRVLLLNFTNAYAQLFGSIPHEEIVSAYERLMRELYHNYRDDRINKDYLQTMKSINDRIIAAGGVFHISAKCGNYSIKRGPRVQVILSLDKLLQTHSSLILQDSPNQLYGIDIEPRALASGRRTLKKKSLLTNDES